MEIICGIYKIENQVNHKIYVGQSVDIYERWRQHKYSLHNGNHYNTHLQGAWNKYGEESFEFCVIQECNKDELNSSEIEYIAYYKSYMPEFGYNLTFGGEGGAVTDEVRKKLSIANIGKNNPMFGKYHTDETKKKISETKIGSQNAMYGKRGVLSPNYGRKRTDEFRKLQSEAHKGKKMSEETRAKQSVVKSGQNNPRSKAVYCPELDEYFWGAQEVQNKYGISRDGVAKCCKDKQKTAGKHPVTGENLHWLYVDKLQEAVVA